jgi:hypothetical protein
VVDRDDDYVHRFWLDIVPAAQVYHPRTLVENILFDESAENDWISLTAHKTGPRSGGGMYLPALIENANPGKLTIQSNPTGRFPGNFLADPCHHIRAARQPGRADRLSA